MKLTNLERLAEKIKKDPDSVIDDLVNLSVCPYEMDLVEQVEPCRNNIWRKVDCVDCWNEIREER